MSDPQTTQQATVDFVAGNGSDYRLNIWCPPSPPPAAGHPVLWVLDGSGYMGLATDMVRNRGVLGQEIAPAVIVAVTYPSDDMAVWMSRRMRDFTATEPRRPGVPGIPPIDPKACGGLEGFLDMIDHDALPIVASRFPVDRQRMAIVGHSLGGLAVLHTLFTRPTMFQSFLAVSPSIWWDDKEVLRHEAAFSDRVRSGDVAPRVFIGVGGLEQTPPNSVPAGQPATLEAIVAHTRASRMIDNAAVLAARLRALPGIAGYAVRYACPAGETHLSVPFAVFGQALDLALSIP